MVFHSFFFRQLLIHFSFESDSKKCIYIFDVISHHRTADRCRKLPTTTNWPNTFCSVDALHTLSIASPRIAPLFEWTVTSDPLFSDHFPLHLVLTCQTPLLSPPSSKKWRTENADWPALNRRMHQLAPYNMNITAPNFLNALERSASETIRSSITRNKTNQRTNAVWWNWRCQRAKALRRRAFRNFQRCICDHHAELYRTARKECAETLRREKQAAWHDFASQCNRFTPLKEIWGHVRAFSSRRNSCIGAFPQLVTSDVVVSEPQDVVDTFAEHFADVSATDIYLPHVHRALTDVHSTLVFSSENDETYNAPFTVRGTFAQTR